MDDVIPGYYFDAAASTSKESKTKKQAIDKQPKKRFCCAVCNNYVTDDALIALIQQQHVHTRTNPQGQSFSFGCFYAAPGCKITGTATDEHSWFGGYCWRFAHCKHCNAQMGWYFSGDTDFFALILEQLIECSDNGDH